MDGAHVDNGTKPASAARIYDYYLGGVHNFPADQEAARRIMAQLPTMPIIARENRAFLGRAVTYLTNAGIRQFLDIGSGIPTEGNVHEIAQAIEPGVSWLHWWPDPTVVHPDFADDPARSGEWAGVARKA